MKFLHPGRPANSPIQVLAPDLKRRRRPVPQAKLSLCPPPAQGSQAPSPLGTLEARSGPDSRTQSPGSAAAGLSPGSRNHRSGETPPLALPRKAWSRRQRGASGHLLTAGPLRRPTRVPLVSSSSPRASRLARPQGSVRAGRGCGAAASSSGPGPTWFRVPGPVGKLRRRARPLPGGLPAPSCASRARHSRGAARRGWEASGRSGRVPDPRLPVGELGGDHPEAPLSAQGEGDVARHPEALRAPLRELHGGGDSQGRVLLAAAPGTSRPPRRRSHGDRKPSRHPERPALAPGAVPDGSWPPLTPDLSGLQAAVRTLECPPLSTEDPSREASAETPLSHKHQRASPPPPSPGPAAGTGGARSRHSGQAGTPAPGPAAGRVVRGEAAWCRVRRARNRKWGSKAVG